MSNPEDFKIEIKENKYLYRIIKRFIFFLPEQKKILIKSLNNHAFENYEILEELAKFINLIADNNLDNLIKNYIWMLNLFKEELYNFMKTDSYRYKTFEEANKNVYSNTEFMRKYMDGLLLSQLFWNNHASAYIHFNDFLNSLNKNFSLLEIGPGHGLYLALIAKNNFCQSLSSWDVSKESLRKTKICLEKLEIIKKIDFSLVDIVKSSKINFKKKYDIIVISEVLEHLEDPNIALNNIYKLLDEKGKLYINFPINSPSPDHLYLLRSIEEVEQLIKDNKFKIISQKAFPSMGYSLKKALKVKATINCIFVVTK